MADVNQNNYYTMKKYFIKDYLPPFLILATFVIYLSTTCPTVYIGDSGELTTAAYSLGIPHPSGYPLYALIGKIFCLIPLGNIAFRMNLMSVVFSLATIWIVYTIIYKKTSSVVSSVFGSFTLAFTSLFWLQSVSAEVYPLHTFFVALLIKLLIYWDDDRALYRLALFSFVAGLSFLNHLQTVMMAPAVIFFLIASDRKSVLNTKALIICSLLFLLALTVYIYLPIRTQAGAAVHWGDPDTLINFFHVVSGENHRSGYVFNKSMTDYLIRSKGALILVVKQFGVILLFGIWGFIRLNSIRWRIFYLGVILFDFFYTVFLNTVFIEVTPFNLPTLIAIAILGGIGLSDLLNRCKNIFKNNMRLYKIPAVACCVTPVIYLAANFGISNQGRNYIAYEHASNIFRTVDSGGTVVAGGDNNLFPVTYTRIVERMGADKNLYDRHNLFFKMPWLGDSKEPFVYYGKWDDLIYIIEKKLIEKKAENGFYFSLFNHRSVQLPDDYALIPYGILSHAVNKQITIDQNRRVRIWQYYSTESFGDTFYQDFMSREVTAYYNFCKGNHLIMLGAVDAGIKRLKLASQIGYNDEVLQNELAIIYSDLGYFNEAREALENSLIYNSNSGWAYNNWGYYYSKLGEKDKAIDSIKKAVELDPDNTLYYNNLGNMFMDTGQKEEAIKVFKKSLSINGDQEGIKQILKENDLTIEEGE